MSVAKIIEITSTSPNSFDDAVKRGISKAEQSVKNIRGAWIKEMKVDVEGGQVTAFRVDMKVTFVLQD